jgi:hypothetical protein
MFVQTLLLNLPPETEANFDAAFHTYYLSELQQCAGFAFSTLVDEGENHFKLLIYWENRGQCQCARCNGQLVAATLQLAAAVPGLAIKTVPNARAAVVI